MHNEGVARVFRGGDPFSMMWMQTWRHIDDVLIDKGVLTCSEASESSRANFVRSRFPNPGRVRSW